MPELPEVEYVRRRLQRWLGGGRVVACAVHDARLVRPLSARAFEKRALGRTIVRVDRRGKWLRLVLDDDHRLFSHLAMTGWFERAASDAPLRHERARLTVVRGGKQGRATEVAYVDARRWGRMLASAEDIPAWSALGPDPYLDRIDVAALHARLARRKKRSIKEALMDQTLLAGVGNIQAAEALWRARIDPRSPAAAVTAKELRAILRGIDWTIARTLADLERGKDGEEDPFLVYGHKGEPCPRCKAVLERIELGGRTTTFCPGCQRRAGQGTQQRKPTLASFVLRA